MLSGCFGDHLCLEQVFPGHPSHVISLVAETASRLALSTTFAALRLPL